MRKVTLMLILLLPVSGCGPEVSERAICNGTAQSRTNAAAAVAADGGDQSVVALDLLIRQIDDACG